MFKQGDMVILSSPNWAWDGVVGEYVGPDSATWQSVVKLRDGSKDFRNSPSTRPGYLARLNTSSLSLYEEKSCPIDDLRVAVRKARRAGLDVYCTVTGNIIL